MPGINDELKIAAKSNFEKLIDHLKGDINQFIFISDFKGTLLTFACKINNIELVNFLLRKGADVNKVYYVGEETESPMSIACKANDIQLAKILLEKGVDVNYIIESSSYLYEACQNGYVEMVELLIKKNADPNIKDGKTGRVPLHELCIRGYSEANIKNLKLLIKKADVNSLDYYGETPLSFACSSGFFEAAKILLENGADINKTEKTNRETALHCAVDSGSIEIVKLLTAHAVDVNAIFYEDEDNEIEGDNVIAVTPLNKAVIKNYIEIAKHLMLYVLLNNPDKPDYITNHPSLSNFWEIKRQELNELIACFTDIFPNYSINKFLFDDLDKLAKSFTLTGIKRLIQKMEHMEDVVNNREATNAEIEIVSYVFLIKNRIEKLESLVKERQEYLNMLIRLKIISKGEKDIILYLLVKEKICSYLSMRDIKNVYSASLNSKSESATDSKIQDNTGDFQYNIKLSSLEQENSKNTSLQNVDEQINENTPRLETAENNRQSNNNNVARSSDSFSSELFANRKRKHDDPDSEVLENKKLQTNENSSRLKTPKDNRQSSSSVPGSSDNFSSELFANRKRKHDDSDSEISENKKLQLGH